MPAKRKGSQEALPPRTLSAFLEDNFRLVTVFGALVAVSTFASNLALRAIGIGLSFLFLVAALLVWIELWRKLPWRGTHWVLFLFRSTLSLITFLIILYWFVFFRDYMGTILPVVLTLALVLVVLQAANRMGLLRRVQSRDAAAGRTASRWIGPIAVLTVLVVATTAMFATGRALAPGLRGFLASLYTLFRTVAP